LRKLLDNTEAEELDTPVTLTITTKCPGKWMIADKETGEVYVPYATPGKLQWKKIATWDSEDA
jgi:hypothetical protein